MIKSASRFLKIMAFGFFFFFALSRIERQGEREVSEKNLIEK